VATFLALGSFLGENWRPVAELVDRFGLYISAILIAAGGLGYLLWAIRVKTRR
jgi:membrane protein DedA with SNARE-associated domain